MSKLSPVFQEEDLMAFLEKKCKKSVIHLQLWPPPGGHISDKPDNICKIELNTGIYTFTGISESFYDHMCNLYHNKPQLLNS